MKKQNALMPILQHISTILSIIEEGRSWNVLIVVPSELPFDTSCYTVSYLARIQLL